MGVGACAGSPTTVTRTAGPTMCATPQVIRSSAFPMKVPGGKRFRSLTKGDLACGLTSEGEALCWGPVKRALGDGSISQQ